LSDLKSKNTPVTVYETGSFLTSKCIYRDSRDPSRKRISANP